MPIPQIILDYLHENCVSYSHERVQAADPRDLSVRNAAKAAIFRSDGRLFMALLNEDRMIDIDAMKQVVGCDVLSVPSEKEVSDRFPSCEPAAIPPFGTLFRIPTYCDRTLAQQPEIKFHAGTAIDMIRMSFSEFVQIEAPIMADFSKPSDSRTNAA